MAYRLRYCFWVDFVGAGQGLGLMAGQTSGPGPTPAGNMQTIEFVNTDTPLNGNTPMPPNSSTFTSTDIGNLTAAAAADMVLQLTAQIARIQAFAQGGG